jgi:hypothetical protein
VYAARLHATCISLLHQKFTSLAHVVAIPSLIAPRLHLREPGVVRCCGALSYVYAGLAGLFSSQHEGLVAFGVVRRC